MFRFTNWTSIEFVGTWNKIQYRFPPMSTSPMVIRGESPEHVQHIRKKFARELAEREFYRSERFEQLDSQAPAGSGKIPAIYSDTEIAPYVQKALEPLPAAFATAKQVPADKTENYHVDVTKVLDNKDLEAGVSLTGNNSAPILG